MRSCALVQGISAQGITGYVRIQRPSAFASCAFVIDERPLIPRLRASEYS